MGRPDVANDFVKQRGNLRRRKEAAKKGGQTGGMKQNELPTEYLTVDEVMRDWPSTIRVFLDFRMGCVGCPIGTFHSVEEACDEHGIDVAVFLPKLRDAA